VPSVRVIAITDMPSVRVILFTNITSVRVALTDILRVRIITLTDIGSAPVDLLCESCMVHTEILSVGPILMLSQLIKKSKIPRAHDAAGGAGSQLPRPEFHS
jgi:hypothetical protein